MSENESPPKPSSIFSERTGISAQSERIVALGRKLVDELELERSGDTLGRWMAHYIAGLITTAESATDNDKKRAEKECFDMILQVWQHRAALPNGKRPYEQLEPVIRAVESLDPENAMTRYHRSAWPLDSEGEKKSEADTWLDLASGIDFSARILVGQCLAKAANDAVDKAQEWVALAEAAGADDGVPEILIRFISNSNDLNRKPDLNAEMRCRLQERLNRLQTFIQLVEQLATNLREQLDALPASTDDDQGFDPDDGIVVSFKSPLSPPNPE